MATERGAFPLEADSLHRGRPLLWVLFPICWAVDPLTTIRSFSVPALAETGSATVGLHWLFGIPGIALEPNHALRAGSSSVRRRGITEVT